MNAQKLLLQGRVLVLVGSAVMLLFVLVAVVGCGALLTWCAVSG